MSALDPLDEDQVTPRVGRRFFEVISSFGRLPLPGHGDTWERFSILASLGEEDLSLARLGEGHADALAILRESGRGIRHPGSSYGVWAARTGTRGGDRRTQVPGGWRLTGSKPFCSGSGLLDRALVTAEAPDGYRLFDIATADAVIDAIPDSWPAVGMADSVERHPHLRRTSHLGGLRRRTTRVLHGSTRVLVRCVRSGCLLVSAGPVVWWPGWWRA